MAWWAIIAPTLAALAAVITAIASAIATLKAINGVHLSLNSRLSELILASKAQGRQEERDDAAAKKVSGS